MIRGEHPACFDIERNDRALPMIHRIIDTALEPLVRCAGREKDLVQKQGVKEKHTLTISQARSNRDREKMKKVRWVRLRIRGAEPMTRGARVSFFLFC